MMTYRIKISVTILAIYFIWISVFHVEYNDNLREYYILVAISNTILLLLSINLFTYRKTSAYLMILYVIFYIGFLIKPNLFVLVEYSQYFQDYRKILYSGRIVTYFENQFILKSLFCSTLVHAAFYFVILVSPKEYKESNSQTTLYQSARDFWIVAMFTFLLSVLCLILNTVAQFESVTNVLLLYFFPLAFIFLLHVSFNCLSVASIKITALLFIIYSLMAFYLLTSKMFLILPIFWIFILQYKYAIKIIPDRVFWFLPIIVISYPIISIFRESRNQGIDLISTIQVYFDSGFFGVIFSSLFAVLNRIVGSDSLIVLINARDTVFNTFSYIDIISDSQTVGQILTRDIIGYDFSMGVAPTLIGQYYFIFGSLTVCVVAIGMYLYFTNKIIEKYNMSNSLILRTYGSFFQVYCVFFFSDGFSTSNFYYLLFSVIVFFIMSSILTFKGKT